MSKVKTMRENPLIQLYEQSTPEQKRDGAAWYPEAHDFCKRLAKRSGYDLVTVCRAVSALSPQLSWNKNKVAAELVLTGRDTRPSGVLHRSLAKARRILRGQTITCTRCPRASRILLQPFCPRHAPKTFNFCLNILDPSAPQWVTIDRHAATAWYATPMRKTKFDYWDVAAEYLVAADALGVVASTFQATIWIVIRDRFAYQKSGGALDFTLQQMGLFTQEEVPF